MRKLEYFGGKKSSRSDAARQELAFFQAPNMVEDFNQELLLLHPICIYDFLPAAPEYGLTFMRESDMKRTLFSEKKSFFGQQRRYSKELRES